MGSSIPVVCIAFLFVLCAWYSVPADSISGMTRTEGNLCAVGGVTDWDAN